MNYSDRFLFLLSRASNESDRMIYWDLGAGQNSEYIVSPKCEQLRVGAVRAIHPRWSPICSAAICAPE